MVNRKFCWCCKNLFFIAFVWKEGKNMRNLFHKLKNVMILIILLLLFFVANAHSYATNVSNGLSSDIFRLHILANSDSEEDQALKLKVRDAIIEYMETLTENVTDKQAVIQLSNEHSEDFKQIAESVIQENGYDYPITIEIGNFYFPTKYYGNISLPAGNYDALKIEIGDAKGQNWWCSLFPPLCFVSVSAGVVDEDGEEYLKKNLSEEEFAIVSESSPDIEFKFKIIELMNEKK